MPGSQDPAKYLNSPTSPLFDKSRSLYGLDLAKQRLIQGRVVAVVEGYTDVMMAHQFGCNQVVATLGTALTPQHVALIKRFADKIVLLFDPDTAGDTAVDRAVELLLTQEKVDVAIGQLPAGLDPDQVLLQQGAAGLEAIIAQATDPLAYKWTQLHRRYSRDGNDLSGQEQAVAEYLGLLAKARQRGSVDVIRWGSVLTRVSRLTEIPVAELNRRFRHSTSAKTMAGARVAATAAATAGPSAPPVTPVMTGRDRAESMLLAILLAEPRLWGHAQKDVGPADFISSTRRKLAEIYWLHQREEGEPVFNEFMSTLEDPEVKSLAAELVESRSSLTETARSADISRDLHDAIAFLQQERRRLLEQKMEAALRQQNPQVSPGDADAAEVDLLRKVAESSKVPNPRRNRW